MILNGGWRPRKRGLSACFVFWLRRNILSPAGVRTYLIHANAKIVCRLVYPSPVAVVHDAATCRSPSFDSSRDMPIGAVFPGCMDYPHNCLGYVQRQLIGPLYIRSSAMLPACTLTAPTHPWVARKTFG